MANDVRQIFLRHEVVAQQITNMQNLIDASQTTHIAHCRQMEQQIYASLNHLPSIRDSLLDYVDIIQQRHKTLFDYYHTTWIPAISDFNRMVAEEGQQLLLVDE